VVKMEGETRRKEADEDNKKKGGKAGRQYFPSHRDLKEEQKNGSKLTKNMLSERGKGRDLKKLRLSPTPNFYECFRKRGMVDLKRFGQAT